MKILFLSYTDSGGAGRAIQNICLSIKDFNLDFDLFVKHKFTKNSFIKTFNNSSFKLKIDHFKHKINRNICKYEKKKIYSFQSPSLFPSNYHKIINNSDYDVVHLNWINDFLSVEDIGKIEKPLVWSLCDMWPFTGINHYDDYDLNVFWRKEKYQIKNNKFSLDSWLLRRKVRS